MNLWKLFPPIFPIIYIPRANYEIVESQEIFVFSGNGEMKLIGMNYEVDSNSHSM